MDILAIDPATKCGWATYHNGSVDSGVWDLRVHKDESTNMRLIRFRAELNGIARRFMPDLLLFEASRNSRFPNAVKVAAQIQAVMEIWGHDNNVDFRGFSPKEIKKFVTDNGNADKAEMISAAAELYPDIPIQDDNHADALCLLSMGRELYS